MPFPLPFSHDPTRCRDATHSLAARYYASLHSPLFLSSARGLAPRDAILALLSTPLPYRVTARHRSPSRRAPFLNSPTQCPPFSVGTPRCLPFLRSTPLSRRRGPQPLLTLCSREIFLKRAKCREVLRAGRAMLRS